jgi:hypothetical protein
MFGAWSSGLGHRAVLKVTKVAASVFRAEVRVGMRGRLWIVCFLFVNKDERLSC